jgi:hypothetical protein
MEQPIQTANYLREVQGLNIKIYNLDEKDKLLWYEVENLLKDNGLWDIYNYDDEDRYFRHAKRIYVVTTKMFNFNYIKNNNQKDLWTPEIKSIIYSPEGSLYRYMYEPEYCDNYYGHERYCIQLPILNEDCAYNYIIILLKNDNVILGRYGVTEFGYQLSECYYDDDIKQVPFDKLDEPYKSLIIEKLLEEEKQGYNMENLIHLYSKDKKFNINDYIVPIKYSEKLCKCNEKLYNVTNRQLAFHDDMYICKNCDKSFHDRYYLIAQKEYMTKKEEEEFNKYMNMSESYIIKDNISESDSELDIIKNNNSKLDIDPQEYDEMMRTNEERNEYKELQKRKATEEQNCGSIIDYDDFIKEEKSKNLLQKKYFRTTKKGNIVMNDPLGRGHFPVSITSSPIRQFSGTIGLLYNNEGYYDYGGEKKLSWCLDDVKELIRKYMRQRSIDKKFDLCIGLSNIETLCYYWEYDFIEEPIVRVYGEIVSRHEGISDEEILNALFELFTYLKVDLKQHSVRFNYQGFTEHKSYRIGNGK